MIDSIGRVFNRFIESPESKDALMNFLNENANKLKTVQALALVSLYPNLAVANTAQWRSVQSKGFTYRVHGSTCAGRNIEMATQEFAGFMFSRTVPSQPIPTITEVTRASPLALALLFSPDTTAKPRDAEADYAPPFKHLHVDHAVHFGFSSLEAGQVTSVLKASVEMGIQWLFTRLACPSLTHTMKEYTEEEIFRYIDNVIRTTVSLLEAEKF